MNKLKDILKDKKKKYILFGIIGLIIISVIVAIILINKPTYSNTKINNLQFKDEVHDLLKEYDYEDLEEMMLNYIKDSMEQYNAIDEDIFKFSAKGQVYEDFFKDEMDIRDYDDKTQDIILDIFNISVVNSKAIVKELKFKDILNPNDGVILNDNYYKYLDNLKAEIDKVVEKYCK